MTSDQQWTAAGEEIAIRWDIEDDSRVTVSATMRGASITISTTPESAHLIPTLLAATPEVLNRAVIAMQEEGDPEE